MSIVEVELKVSEGGSDPVATMSKQAGSRSRKSSCGGSSSRASTMSSAAKLRMSVRLAEARLKHVEEEQSLRFKTQQAVLQAKAAVKEARIKAEAMQESEGVSSVLDEVGPAVSSQDKIGFFLESLQNHDRIGSSVQPDLNFSPTTLPNGSLYEANKATGSYLNANTNPWHSERKQPKLLGPLASDKPAVANFDVPRVLHGPAAADANPTRVPSGPAAAYFSPSGDSNEPAVGSNQSKSSVCTMEELARVMIRCQGSGALGELEKFNGDPLRYHLFMRQVEDRILSIYRRSDPGHALQLLLNSTTGRARKLISSCITLRPDEALQSALRLLEDAFGSPDIAIKAHLNLVTKGPVIRVNEESLHDFYSDLINCKMVVEASGAVQLLNSAATIEGLFARLPRSLQERFADLALRRGYGMEIVPFDVFIEFIDQNKRLAASRLGRLMETAKVVTSPSYSKWAKPKMTRANFAKVEWSIQHNKLLEARKSGQPNSNRSCTACDSLSHPIWKCKKFIESSISERRALVKQKGLCFNCLGKDHLVKVCSNKKRCKTCSGNHHSFLHFPNFLPKQPKLVLQRAEDSTATSISSPEQDQTIVLEDSHFVKGKKRLQVLPVCVTNLTTGKGRNILALLDSGADTHLLTKEVFVDLDLNGKPIESNLQLADGAVKKLSSFETTFSVRGVNKESSFILDEIRIVETMPDLSQSIPSPIDVERNRHLQDIMIPIIDAEQIDLIIGMDAPGLHVFSEVRKGGDSSLWAGRSPLGWVFFGRDYGHVNTSTAVVSDSHVNLLVSPDLEKTVSWLRAPTFLFQDESNWPAANRPTTKRIDGLTAATSVDSIDDDIQHDNKDSLSLPITKQDVLHRIIERYSILSDAVRTSAWLLRLKQLLKCRAKGLTLPSIANEPIDSKEFDAALLALIRLCQQQAFPGLVEALEVDPWYKVAGRDGDKEMKRTLQSISKYCPFVANGVIRVGGRLQRSDLPYDFKHSVVLPKEHHLTGLIILHAHYRACHSSATYVMNELRKRYHVVGQRRTVKQYIKRNCMICRNQKAVPGSQLMSPLPAGRVIPSRGAFEHCGVDYMRPLEIKQGRNSLSRYCCVFTCLASRAVHLEMAYDLSTDSFLMAFRRFLSVRGDTTRVMYSDNGTNFVEANSQLQKGLKRIDQRRIVNELAPRGIEWKHAPLASHQGGIYEAMIRLVRKNMNLIMADKRLRTLTDEGLQTLLKKIEHILNCRPLTELTDEVENTTALTPMMLLSGCVDPGYPPDVFLDSDGMRSSWRACQLQADVFWDRWRFEYLHLLQRRQKWLTPQRNLCVGDLVLLVDENAHRNIWPKGVIEEVLPDRDGMVRRVRVRTGK